MDPGYGFRETGGGSTVATCLILLVAAVNATAPAVDEYIVSDAWEFVDALGPDRTILIDEGRIFLSDLIPEEGDPPDPGPWARWETVHDGCSLVISDLDNLTITGTMTPACSLMTDVRYAFVLEFEDCSDLYIGSLTMGHSPDGYCDKGVLGLTRCTDVTVDMCDFYGCGIEGITLWNSNDVVVMYTRIHDCVYGIMSASGSSDVYFSGCEFTDNQQYYGVDFRNCSDVVFSECLFEYNYVSDMYSLFELDGCSDIHLQDCGIRYNHAREIFSTTDCVTMENVEME
jgi:hypothetical protein